MAAKSSTGRLASVFSTRPSSRTLTAASTEHSPRGEADSAADTSPTDSESFQSELVSSLLKHLIDTVKTELRAVLESELAVIRADITAARSELKEHRESMTSELSALSGTVKDVQQLLVSKEELPPEQQEWSHILDQEDTKPQHIKEEHEEVWISQLQGLEEADTTKFPFTPVSVKSEDDEEKPQSSQLHHRQTEQMETGADGEDCGGAEPERDSDPERGLQLETEVKTEDSDEPETKVKTEDYHEPETEVQIEDSEPETDYSDDWQETREHLSELNSKLKTGWRPHSCLDCGKIFNRKQHLTSHMMVHTGEKPFNCSQCEKRFNRKQHLTRHMLIHTGAKPFSCSQCEKRFGHKSSLTSHMLIHTGEKPFSCSQCEKRFGHKSSLRSHMAIHTGEKPFSCSVCSKRFTHRKSRAKHMLIHTGVKPFSCSKCGKRFNSTLYLTKHMMIHTGEKW